MNTSYQFEAGWPARMWPCGRVRQQGAGPGRKVSFSGRLGAFPLSLPCEGLLWAGPLPHLYLDTAAPSVALPGCGFPLSGRNTGSVSRGQGLWFPVAEPGPGREATNEVCVSEREAGSQLQMSLFVQGQPGPAWVDPSAPLALALPHPAKPSCLPPGVS